MVEFMARKDVDEVNFIYFLFSEIQHVKNISMHWNLLLWVALMAFYQHCIHVSILKDLFSSSKWLKSIALASFRSEVWGNLNFSVNSPAEQQKIEIDVRIDFSVSIHQLPRELIYC